LHYDCEPVANNLSPVAVNLSRTTISVANNLSQESACLQAKVIMFASRNNYITWWSKAGLDRIPRGSIPTLRIDNRVSQGG
jgi:hypothetical protein